MKKLVTAACMAVCAASLASAVTVKASTVMEGSVMEQDTDKDHEFHLFHLNDRDQKDEDSLLFEINGERAGAYFRGFYKYTDKGGDGYDFKMRNPRVWFKPIDMLKITVGDVSSQTYVERINWWKTQTGEKGIMDKCFSSFATLENAGFLLTLTPIDGLEANLGFATGCADDWFYSKEDRNKDDGTINYHAYGASVKYKLTNDVSAAIAWRDKGRKNEKVLAIGADYGYSNWKPVGGFLNVRLNFNSNYSERVELRAIVFDNYFKYTLDNLVLEAALPVTVRLANDVSKAQCEGDPSYMTFDVRATYNQDWGSPYLRLYNNDGDVGAHGWAPIVFKDYIGDAFGMVVQPGAKFSFDGCNIDIGLRGKMTSVRESKGDHYFGWSIPVEVRVNF